MALGILFCKRRKTEKLLQNLLISNLSLHMLEAEYESGLLQQILAWCQLVPQSICSWKLLIFLLNVNMSFCRGWPILTCHQEFAYMGWEIWRFKLPVNSKTETIIIIKPSQSSSRLLELCIEVHVQVRAACWLVLLEVSEHLETRFKQNES